MTSGFIPDPSRPLPFRAALRKRAAGPTFPTNG